MNFLQQLNEIKNKIHKEIVFAVINEQRAIDEDFILELDEQVNNITGVTSVNNQLVGINSSGIEVVLQYKNISIEDLAKVQQLLFNKKYKLQILA